VGVVVKHRQLACQVGVFIEHPLENLMVSLSFTSNVLDEGTTFVFGSWICVANGLGCFNSHLVNSKKSEASAATRHSNLDSFIGDINELLPPQSAQVDQKDICFRHDFKSCCTRTTRIGFKPI
jgi:hypothetical protein